MKKYSPCPCHSKLPYSKCCQPYHEGAPCPDAQTLMRSRYSAFALKLADYIIKTTHPENAQFQENKATWRKDLEDFSGSTSFDGLKIEEFTPGEQKATVTFTAYIRQGSHDLSFREKSDFTKVNEHWLYRGAEMLRQ